MKAIVTNHKRSAVCDQEITFEEVQKFISNEFPRMKDVSMKFKDMNGEEITITSQEDISLLKKIYDGQNFVQIQIGGKLPHNKGHGHGHKHGHGHGHGHGHRHRHDKERESNSQ